MGEEITEDGFVPDEEGGSDKNPNEIGGDLSAFFEAFWGIFSIDPTPTIKEKGSMTPAVFAELAQKQSAPPPSSTSNTALEATPFSNSHITSESLKLTKKIQENLIARTSVHIGWKDDAQNTHKKIAILFDQQKQEICKLEQKTSTRPINPNNGLSIS